MVKIMIDPLFIPKQRMSVATTSVMFGPGAFATVPETDAVHPFASVTKTEYGPGARLENVLFVTPDPPLRE